MTSPGYCADDTPGGGIGGIGGAPGGAGGGPTPGKAQTTPGIGHNGPPPELVEGDIIVTARIVSSGVAVGVLRASALLSLIIPTDSAGESEEVLHNLRNYRRVKIGTSTVDRSDELRRLRAVQDAQAQAERSEGNSGLFGFFYNLVKALTGN